MTNNKQQTAVDVAELSMKLYPFSNSERNAFITGYNKAKEIEKEQRSIELPSDEEIKKSTPYPLSKGFYNPLYSNKWEEGAKWMRDKIQGGEQ